MGIYDRDYYRAPTRHPRTPFGGMRMWTVTTWLIAINVAVFVLNSTFYQIISRGGQVVAKIPLIEAWGHFSVDTAIFQFQLWRFITFQFLHADLFHLLFNMIGLYFFGPMIESYLGSRRFLVFYLLCGMAGPFGYMLLWAWSNATTMQLIQDAAVPLVGASAGIFGILIAAAQIAPDATVLVYGFFPVRLRVLAWVLLAVALYTVLTSGNNAGGEAAHLGGAVMGWLLIRNPHVLDLLLPPERRRMQFR